ncbi:MAG: maleylpyruvate isomerase family mycothiol-dependent enzyme [Ilumatobacteraceae bacterium]
MTTGRTLADALRWLTAGTTLFSNAIEDLDEAALREPSQLAGWSRAHVLAHVGFNAVALMNLVMWAHTGVANPMYSSAMQRDSDIERGATWSVPELRTFVVTTAADLSEGLASLDERTWGADVVTALGRTVTAKDLPWLRVREVTVHAIDLGRGVTFRDVPADLTSALLTDAADRRTSLARDAPMTLVAEEGGRWQIGVNGDRTPRTVGPQAELAAWITGRSDGEGLRSGRRPLPQLSPWL